MIDSFRTRGDLMPVRKMCHSLAELDLGMPVTGSSIYLTIWYSLCLNLLRRSALRTVYWGCVLPSAQVKDYQTHPHFS